jgi:hypothetical protein
MVSQEGHQPGVSRDRAEQVDRHPFYAAFGVRTCPVMDRSPDKERAPIAATK